jgi:hypothetical protein
MKSINKNIPPTFFQPAIKGGTRNIKDQLTCSGMTEEILKIYLMNFRTLEKIRSV